MATHAWTNTEAVCWNPCSLHVIGMCRVQGFEGLDGILNFLPGGFTLSDHIEAGPFLLAGSGGACMQAHIRVFGWGFEVVMETWKY